VIAGLPRPPGKGGSLNHPKTLGSINRNTVSDVVVRVIDYRIEDPGRPQAGPRYRLITTILDPGAAPAAELAALYPQRWEFEIGHLWYRSSCAASSWLCSLFLVRFLLRLCPAGAGVEARRACPAFA
jgi:hypothetical protein